MLSHQIEGGVLVTRKSYHLKFAVGRLVLGKTPGKTTACAKIHRSLIISVVTR